MGVLRGLPDIGVVALTARDVIRHELVLSIVEAYERQASRE